MTVGANTYAAVTDVQRLIGDIVADRTFGAATEPSITQAEAELDNTAFELNEALDVAGYTVPVDSTAYPTAYGAMVAANAYGASARLLGTIPTEAYDPDQEMVDMGNTG